MGVFNEFCEVAKVSEQSSKLDVAIAFMWFHQYKIKKNEITLKEINNYFAQSDLSLYNSTYLSYLF